MFPLLASCNYLAGTPMEAPLDGSITTASYTEHKHLQNNPAMTLASMDVQIKPLRGNCRYCLPVKRFTISSSSSRRSKRGK
jgi:hypothetical protein